MNTANDLEIVAFVQDLVENPALDAVSYAAEAGQFAEGGFQAIICGSGDIAQAHRANEFIDKDQLRQGMAFMDKLIKRIC
uniref:M20/M25/M40 family metallo-hydrolase n=1 Tax=Roseivirga sp. TaxID=1964215 RepID=UPI004047301A